MGQEYALIYSIERNHRLRRAPPHAPPPAELPDRPGQRVRFADPPVTGSKADNSASRSGYKAGLKVSASAKGGGVYVSRVPALAADLLCRPPPGTDRPGRADGRVTKGTPSGIWVPGREVMVMIRPLEDSDSRPKGEIAPPPL